MHRTANQLFESRQAGDDVEIQIGERTYRLPLNALSEASNSIDRASDAYVTAAHCAEAVGLIFSAAVAGGWEIFPPVIERDPSDAKDSAEQT